MRLPVIALLLGACSLLPFGSARAEAQAGRYQLAVGVDGPYLVDSATGDIWHRDRNGVWYYEGNPTRSQNPKPKPQPFDSRKLKVQLETVPTTLRVDQHQQAVVPGTDGKLYLSLGDITGGAVTVTVIPVGGTAITSKVMRPDNLISIPTASGELLIALKALNNVLLGNDTATFEISVKQRQE